jgi:hypothetical protein
MKTGFEQRGKVILMIVLFAAMIGAFWYSFSGPSTAQSAAASAVPAQAPAQGRPAPVQRKVRQSDRERAARDRSLDPTLHTEWLKSSEDVEYKGSKRNIFSAEAEAPVEVKPKQPKIADTGPHCPNDADPRCPPVCPNPANPRCPPPPIPLQFFGFASRPGEPKRIFLKTTDTNDVFVASEGEVVNRRFRILRIMATGVEVEDVLNNNKQVLPLMQG